MFPLGGGRTGVGVCRSPHPETVGVWHWGGDVVRHPGHQHCHNKTLVNRGERHRHVRAHCDVHIVSQIYRNNCYQSIGIFKCIRESSGHKFTAANCPYVTTRAHFVVLWYYLHHTITTSFSIVCSTCDKLQQTRQQCFLFCDNTGIAVRSSNGLVVIQTCYDTLGESY